jgi:hypothetical protein
MLESDDRHCRLLRSRRKRPRRRADEERDEVAPLVNLAKNADTERPETAEAKAFLASK